MLKDKTSQNRLKINVLFFISVGLIFINILSILIVAKVEAKKNNTYVSDTLYNISSIAFDKNQQAYLNGQWEFYYNTLLITDKNELNNPSAYLKVPSSWFGKLKNNSFPNGGYASYRSYIKNASKQEGLKIYIPNIACAYRIFINGSLVSSSGVVSKNSSEVFTTPENCSIPVNLDEGEYELVVEVAANRFSGLYLAPMIVNYDYDNGYVKTLSSIRLAFIGIVLFCSIITFVFLYFFNNKMYSYWQPLLFFVLFIRMSVTTETYSFTQLLLFNTSYENINIFVMFFTFAIKLIALMNFYRCINTLETTLKVCFTFIISFSTLAVVMSFITDFAFDQYYFLIYQFLTIIIDLYIVYKLCIEVVKKTEYAIFYLFSYSFLVIGIEVESLYLSLIHI